jgi:hypothetical protein
VNVVRAKADVQFATIAPAGFRILAALDALARTLRKDILLTCGTEAHTNPDPHATGEAYDVGLVGWTPADITTALATLRATLGPAFTVLYEVAQRPSDPALAALAFVNPKATGPHFHIQRTINTVYP